MQDACDPVGARLEGERKELLDLSLRNPLLNYRPRTRGLEFVGVEAGGVVRELVGRGRAIPFRSAVGRGEAAREDSAGMELAVWMAGEALRTRLLAIAHAARTAVEEQGVNLLFLALGRLTRIEDEARPRCLMAPLILVPVELARAGARQPFRLRHDGQEPGGNLSLAEKLRVEFGILLPDLPEADELDVPAYFDAVAGAIGDRPGWAVDRGAAVLGFFSFSKFLMHRDLDPASWPEEAQPAGQPILRALLGEGFRKRDRAEDGPADLRVVVEADATQERALRDVAVGRDLVIQGPPGTGKSQTIANLIADAVGRGKSVLFVAEKLAALEVVRRRLEAVGLGAACLELHGREVRKRAVLDQLRRSLRSVPQPVPAEEDLRARDELRDRLETYAGAVAEPIGSSGVAPHEAVGEILRLRGELEGLDYPPVDLPDPADWSAAEWRKRRALVARYQGRLSSVGNLTEHPFRGVRRAEWLPGDAEAVRDRLREARRTGAALREAAAALARFLRLPAAGDRADCEALSRVAGRVTEAARWQGAQVRGEWASRFEDLREVLEAGAALAELSRRHESTLLPTAWDQDPGPVRQALNAHGRRWWRPLAGDYRRACLHLAAICRGAPPGSLDEQLSLLDIVREGRRLREVLRRHESLAARLFGRRWRGESSDWRALGELAEGMRRLHLEIREGRLPRGLLDFLAEAPALAGLETLTRAVEVALTTHREAIGRLVAFLDLEEATRFGAPGSLADRPFAEQEALLEASARRIPDLDRLADLNHLANRCRAEGLAGVVTLAESWPGAVRHLVAVLEEHRYRALLRRAYQERPALAEFDTAAHEQTVRDFRELDIRALSHDRARIAQAHRQRRPDPEGDGPIAVLRRELVKKTRHLPVRQLMTRAGTAVQAITPVFLMSPLSVAAHLPPGALTFDLVVFDEASQVRPVDALGALLRGRQAVVVGDSRQLPPTSFFDRLSSGDEPDDDDDETSGEVESILGLFVAQGAPERMLRWHYRSRHESLIAVSNREFYDGRLVVFPSPDAGRGESGLVLRHLPEAVYDRGRSRTNPAEAEAVARAVLDFAREQRSRPPRLRLSLGVATFSTAQRQAIADRLESLREEDPSCEAFFDPDAAEPFFVKNLENVQGDERDVIYISVGYGRTADGAVSRHFGPLNADGGERRLNVLITRARVRCEVFSNLTAADLDAGRTRSRGVQALGTFLAAAQTSAPGEPPSHSPGEVGSPFAAAVRAAIESAGFRVQAGVGSESGRIDLAILDPSRPGRFLLGLDCDGPRPPSSGPTRDRERLRPQVLEGLGWRLHPARAPAWLRDPSGERDRILAELTSAGPPHLP